MDQVDAAVLITKKITHSFIREAIRFKNKVIVHVTCTGLGNTIFEPNVPDYKDQIDRALVMVRYGFPKDQIIIRFDPIIPVPDGIYFADSTIRYAESNDFHKFRVSIIDMYPHVANRFNSIGLGVPFKGFKPPAINIEHVSDMLRRHSSSYITTCAEDIPGIESTGCISGEVLDILGIKYDESITSSLKNNRQGCKCLKCKTELLSNRQPCPNNCLYCYWKKPEEM